MTDMKKDMKDAIRYALVFGAINMAKACNNCCGKGKSSNSNEDDSSRRSGLPGDSRGRGWNPIDFNERQKQIDRKWNADMQEIDERLRKNNEENDKRRQKEKEEYKRSQQEKKEQYARELEAINKESEFGLMSLEELTSMDTSVLKPHIKEVYEKQLLIKQKKDIEDKEREKKQIEEETLRKLKNEEERRLYEEKQKQEKEAIKNELRKKSFKGFMSIKYKDYKIPLEDIYEIRKELGADYVKELENNLKNKSLTELINIRSNYFNNGITIKGEYLTNTQWMNWQEGLDTITKLENKKGQQIINENEKWFKENGKNYTNKSKEYIENDINSLKGALNEKNYNMLANNINHPMNKTYETLADRKNKINKLMNDINQANIQLTRLQTDKAMLELNINKVQGELTQVDNLCNVITMKDNKCKNNIVELHKLYESVFNDLLYNLNGDLNRIYSSEYKNVGQFDIDYTKLKNKNNWLYNFIFNTANRLFSEGNDQKSINIYNMIVSKHYTVINKLDKEICEYENRSYDEIKNELNIMEKRNKLNKNLSELNNNLGSLNPNIQNLNIKINRLNNELSELQK